MNYTGNTYTALDEMNALIKFIEALDPESPLKDIAKTRLAALDYNDKPIWSEDDHRTYEKTPPKRRHNYHINEWSEKDLKFLLDNYGRMPSDELAFKLNRSRKSVQVKFYYAASEELKLKLKHGFVRKSHSYGGRGIYVAPGLNTLQKNIIKTKLQKFHI